MNHLQATRQTEFNQRDRQLYLPPHHHMLQQQHNHDSLHHQQRQNHQSPAMHQPGHGICRKSSLQERIEIKSKVFLFIRLFCSTNAHLFILRSLTPSFVDSLSQVNR